MPPPAATLVQLCSDRYVETLGLRFLAGRAISALELEAGRKVAVVNQTFATRYLGGIDPLGREIRLPRLTTLPAPVPDPSFVVIGVVSDSKNRAYREPPAPHVFVPYTVRPSTTLNLLVRTATDPAHIVKSVRREIQAVNAQAALVEPDSLDAVLERAFFARPRFSVLMLAIFACTGVALVAVGVYGVLAYTVSQQTREIAIRMALGGDRSDVVRMIVRLGLKLVVTGLVIGSIASLATNRLLVDQLWNTSPYDPATFVAALLAILAIAALACLVPARRAVRIEPMVALRHD
jgi:putative ABC transport system permease protein